MTAVLADGRVLELGSSRVRKDNTGYKLQNLLLGAEGTLGIVTEVAMQCHPLPSSRQAAWLACPNFEGVLAVRRAARSMLGEVLAAMEWMDGPILDVVLRHQPALRSPVASTSPSFSHHVLVETHGSNENHDAEKMEAFLERVLQSDWAADGALARSVEHLAAFWKLREGCNPAMAAGGYTYKYDVSIPTAQFGEFVDAVEHRVREFFGSQGGGRSGASSSVGQEGEGGVVVAGWGHILDGNLHLNVHRKGRRQPDPDVASFLDRLVYEGVISRGGSISAEHGVGVAKKAWVPRVHSAATLETMRDVKRLFDPDYILNPGKIF
jgi:FAD/FMN-containing dehydrogenase